MDSSVHSWVIYCVLMAIVTLAAVIDYKTHHIPNWLAFSGWYLGPLLHLISAGMPAVYGSLFAQFAVLLLTFPLFAMNWMGAGDVKLLTSVAALTGIDHAALFICAIVITGFVIGAFQLLRHGALMSFMRRFWVMIGFSITAGRAVYVGPDETHRHIIMPYAVPIAIGTAVALCLI